MRSFRSLPFFFLFFAAACSTSHPCQEAGDPAREALFKGTRQCQQHKGPDGRYVNHGLYREWYPNGHLALEGQYNEGRKSGKWIEWDANGRKISERVYENGEIVK